MTSSIPFDSRRQVVRVRTAAGAYRRRRRIGAGIAVAAPLAMLGALFFLQPADRGLGLPLLALVEITLVFVLVLWVRDGIPPVFEAGALCALANTLYGAFPLAGFIMMHGQWATYADSRLQAYPFDARELAAFGWRYVVYGASFVAAYLVVRRHAAVRTTAFRVPRPTMQAAIVIVFAGLYLARAALKAIWGYDPISVSYDDLATAAVQFNAIPFFIRQVGHNVLGASFVAQQAVIILLLAQWRKRWCRYALAIWMVYEVVSTGMRLGSRTTAVLLLITCGVVYHRLVKPLSFRVAIFAGAALLTAFFLIGVLRGRREAENPVPINVVTAANEFQGLFTTAFDIHKRKEAGEIAAVPWQLYVSDFYMPFPAQLLPFEKIDPSTWYIDLIGQTGSGTGFMFGVMSQTVLGFGWIEIVLRGAVLAVFLAMLQRWYVRHAIRFWPMLFFLFVSIWTYTTSRASTFYFIYFIVYHYLPVLLAAKLFDVLLTRLRRGGPALEPVRS